MKLSKAQQSILTAYVKLAKEKRYFPSRTDLFRAGISRDKIRHSFSSLQHLKELVIEQNPDLSKIIIDQSLITPEAIQELNDELSKYRGFVITTAVGGAPVHKKFLKSLKAYCDRNGYKLLILMCEDPASANKFVLPRGLETEQIVFTDVRLNNNVFISTIKLPAKMFDPSTSLSRIGQRSGSFIYASPKQRLKFSPVANQRLPHALMTTGAITLPNYKTEHYLSERTAYIASHDHVLGAIIVEIQDDEIFHFRQVQAEPNTGYFVDLGTYYKGNDIAKLRPKILFGDWHSGETDPVAKQASKELVDLVNPTSILVSDTFNGKSISHHEKNKRVSRARNMEAGLLSLEDELKGLAKDFVELQTWADELVIVKSNHDEFLDEILEDGRFVNDPLNYRVCARLASAMIEGHDPLKYAIEELLQTDTTKMRWLSLDEDYIFAGVQMGAHGHKGPNGVRGNLKNLESAYGNCMIGHSHTPGILYGAWQVGTLSFLRVGYNHGASSWFHTNGLVYENGARQLVNIIDGAWRIK